MWRVRHRFSQNSTLISHRHTPGRSLTCVGVCGRGFSLKSHLNRHQNTHSGHKPTVCKDCGRVFSQQSNLIRHQRTHSRGRSPWCVPSAGEGSARSRTSWHTRGHTPGEAVRVQGVWAGLPPPVSPHPAQTHTQGNSRTTAACAGEALQQVLLMHKWSHFGRELLSMPRVRPRLSPQVTPHPAPDDSPGGRRRVQGVRARLQPEVPPQQTQEECVPTTDHRFSLTPRPRLGASS